MATFQCISSGRTANIRELGRVSVGCIYARSLDGLWGYRLFGGSQLDAMIGAGTFAGWGMTVSRTTSD